MTITIDKVVYDVIAEDTCDDKRALKEDMARRGFVSILTVKRPKGRRVSAAYKTADGRAVIVATF